MYIYKTKVGNFIIRFFNGRFQLWLNDELLGSYYSAVAAADDVYTFTTGSRWDLLEMDYLEGKIEAQQT